MLSAIKYKLYYLIPIVFLGILFGVINLSCSSKIKKTEESPKKEMLSFDEYWYQGKAEITSYELSQARYGELRKGSAVFVFVTEPFSKSKQVKLNSTEGSEQDLVNVLKLNFSKQFITGIYNYSMLQSIFTPVDLTTNQHSIKTTTSIQEWCGQTFTQLNLQDSTYNVLLRSYFENEGDQQFQLKKVILEDELWNLIRIAPDKLPLGHIQLIPSIMVSSLIHQPLQPTNATAEVLKNKENNNLMTYVLTLSALNRTVLIHYHKKFPHEIEGWEETYMDAGKLLTTKATRKKTILSAYWNQNDNASLPLRKELGLD